MLKIPSTSQIKELDVYTIREQKIPSIELMERACHAFTRWYTTVFDNHKSIGVVCGPGNNGGDGFGIARMLLASGYRVKVWKVKGGTSDSADCQINQERFAGKAEVHAFVAENSEKTFEGCQVLIDALFGSGLTRAPEGAYAHAIHCMNNVDAVRVAVDIPSGLLADAHTAHEAVKAHFTATFQLPKLAFMFPENHRYVGSWHLLDIGLSKSFIRSIETPYRYVTRKSVKNIFRQPEKFDHKGDHGRALLIAGCKGKMGACVLAARAAVRSGIGLLTVHVPAIGYDIIQTSVPEAMATIDPAQDFFSEPPSTEPFNAIGVGPGIGLNENTANALQRLLSSGKRMVIDADALNILSTHSDWLQEIPGESVLTPHPGEFERLAGAWRDDFERLQRQVNMASATKSVIILKGAHTSTATPEGRVYFNSTGNPGMATGGTGDVLTGIVTGLSARGYTAKWAAILGVYVHGLAGDLAARDVGRNSLTASDVILNLGKAFKALE